MRSISDVIEAHLKRLIDHSQGGVAEVQRVQLAETFRCVPSQINYVIQTRFTIERGYLVESKRGGGGYIRIQKLTVDPDNAWLKELYEQIGDAITQASSEGMLYRLQEAGKLTPREVAILNALIHRETLALETKDRDRLRARMMKRIIAILLKGAGGEARAL
ncbi:MAG: CtsR family transcriptional regulator [Candidatus Carbobacillus sp.]|nr:CtsR family transcriptional regulator [Candidatus Carbobacillus sp.]